MGRQFVDSGDLPSERLLRSVMTSCAPGAHHHEHLRCRPLRCYTRRVERRPLPTAVVGAVAGLGTVALTACGGPPGAPQPSSAVSVSASTSPEDVVRSYLGALQQGEESTATSLTTDPYAGRDDWAADPPRIEDVQVSPAVPEPTTGTAAEGHAQAVHVPVTFVVHGADETVPDGRTSWVYVLVRDGDAEAWRIADAGST